MKPQASIEDTLASLVKDFGVAFVGELSGVPGEVIYRAFRGLTPLEPEHISAIAKAKLRCYSFHPQDVLVSCYEEQGSIRATAKLLNVEHAVVLRALARGSVHSTAMIQLRLLALWEVWKIEARATRHAIKSYQEKNK